MLVIEILVAPVLIYMIARYLERSHRESEQASFRNDPNVVERPKMSIKIRGERI